MHQKGSFIIRINVDHSWVKKYRKLMLATYNGVPYNAIRNRNMVESKQEMVTRKGA